VLEPADEPLHLPGAHLGPNEIQRLFAPQRRLSPPEPGPRSLLVPFEKLKRGAKNAREPDHSIRFFRLETPASPPSIERPRGNAGKVRQLAQWKSDVPLKADEGREWKPLLDKLHDSVRFDLAEAEKEGVIIPRIASFL
jgi:hypothetical protein